MNTPMIASPLFRFWLLRQPECEYPIDVVSVSWLGGGRENKCLRNALKAVVPGKNSIVSGWLVTPFDDGNQWQVFAHHWWNYDIAEKRYFDTSPDIEDGSIYIKDMDIFNYATKNGANLLSHVCLSILLKDGTFFLLKSENGNFLIRPFERLTTDALYSEYVTQTPTEDLGLS